MQSVEPYQLAIFKCKSPTFRRKNPHLSIIIQSDELDPEEEIKFFGVILDHKLNYKQFMFQLFIESSKPTADNSHCRIFCNRKI